MTTPVALFNFAYRPPCSLWPRSRHCSLRERGQSEQSLGRVHSKGAGHGESEAHISAFHIVAYLRHGVVDSDRA